MPEPGQTDNQALFVEYAATHDAYLHYDAFTWNVGSVLIAGAFVFWGLAVSADASGAKAMPVVIGAYLVSLLMSVWLLYAHHCRQIYLAKLHRIHQIEEQLQMQQHVRWINNREMGAAYRFYGPKGHVLNLTIYWITSIGTAVVVFFVYGPGSRLALLLLFPVIVTIVVTLTVRQNEKMIRQHLAKL